jgi:hypothetical protein
MVLWLLCEGEEREELARIGYFFSGVGWLNLENPLSMARL